jgi:hypothetical protein
MVLIVQPGGAGSRGRTVDTTSKQHYTCGIVGLGLTAVSIFFAYSVLVAVASLVPLLSTTAIVFVAVVTWFLLWLTLDVAWSWMHTRRATS